MLISIPPHLKGKSSIWIAQNVERKPRNFLGQKFWARAYFVSTVGRNEEMIRAYIRNQEIAGVGSAAIEARVLMKSHLSSQNPL
jgi:putative transposase